LEQTKYILAFELQLPSSVDVIEPTLALLSVGLTDAEDFVPQTLQLDKLSGRFNYQCTDAFFPWRSGASVASSLDRCVNPTLHQCL